MKYSIAYTIKELFRRDYNLQPEHYPDTLVDSINSALMVAKGYWENRTEEEMIRDAKAGVNLADYENWVKAELTELKKQSV